MTQFYVVGGRQRPGIANGEGCQRYGTGVICLVDSKTREARPVVEHVTPPELCAPDDPLITFNTATLVGDRLYTPTETELIIYDLPDFHRRDYISLPFFNDVHHVRPGSAGDTLLAVVTGLDMVVEVGLDGSVLREWSAVDEDIWARFSREVDYRRVSSTKPHKAHPNHVTILGNDIWVTRCHQGDLKCLTSAREPVKVADTYIHDGLLRSSRCWFTTVRGQLVEVDTDTMMVSRRFDLNTFARSASPLGWCRGIEVLEDGVVVVGFSRLRRTKWKDYVKWVTRRLGVPGARVGPTGLMAFDLRRGSVMWEIDLEPAGMNVIFSVHRVPGT